MHITPVILCGGSGTRLWPLSRTGFPKQFLALSGTNSLFQQAIERIQGLVNQDIQLNQTLVVTNEAHRFLALEQIREIQNISASLLLEPSSKNTAPALTLAALQAAESGDDPILVITPADQTISDIPAFTFALQNAVSVAASGAIAILGITPKNPATGYGYIRQTGDTGKYNDFQVAEFVEKPDQETAEHYLASGQYTWNSGMFVLRASIWLQALAQFRPDILEATTAAWAQKNIDTPFIRPHKNLFEKISGESIDYAVMEKCPASSFPMRIIPLDAGWNDLGAWDAVWEVSERDCHGNVHTGDVLIADTNNTLVHASSRLVGAVGVNNLIIVETPDAVMVADRSQSQNVKKIVNTLEQLKREEHTLHRKVHRPWGWYDSIDEADRFKVKHIQVKPGASLSLQKHHHRAEHWIVVKGTAEVTCGSKTILLTENQSTYIPLGELHRLSNPGSIPLEIIEVQSGSYLGEDDIVRIQDNYGRSQEHPDH